MTPEDMVTALRICGNHPTMEGYTCLDCPYNDLCDPRNTARMDLEAADVIEKCLKEIERLKRYEQAVEQILKPDADEMMGRIERCQD